MKPLPHCARIMVRSPIPQWLLHAALWSLTPIALASPPPPLSLHEAVETALIQRLEVRAAKLQTEIAEAVILEAEGGHLPLIEATAESRRTVNYDTFTGTQVSATINGTPVTATVTKTVPKYQTSAGFQLTWSIYTGGELTARLRSAHANAEGSRIERFLATRATILDVVAAHCQLRKAQNELQVAIEAHIVARESERIAKNALEARTASQLAYETVSLQAAQTEMRVASARAAIDEHWRAYYDALGIPYQPEIANTNPSLEENWTLNQQIQQWKSWNASTAEKAIAQASAAWNEVEVEKSNTRPKIDFVAAYSHVGRDNNSTASSFNDLSRQQFYLGVRLRWNLFDGGQSQARVKRRIAEAHLMELRAAREIINNAQTRSHNRAKTIALEQEISILEKKLNLAHLEKRIAQTQRESREIQETQYRHKELAVLEAELKLTNTRIDLAFADLVHTLEPEIEQ